MSYTHLESIYTLPEFQENVGFKWLHEESNPETLNSYTNTRQFNQTDQMMYVCV